MINKLKKLFYFPIAYYFRFFAKIQLSKWHPRIIVVTGSSGKTTLLHLIESQLLDRARYSHQANSTYGIPFDILGLHRKKLTIGEWPYLFLAAPFKAFKKPPKEKLYIVEADCDRPNEGKFLASFLKPEITLWTNVGRAHSMNFDTLVKNEKFSSAEEAIAYEFGYFLEYTQKLAIVNDDSTLIRKQLVRTHADVKTISNKSLLDYKIYNNRTEFVIEDKKYSINFIVPKDMFYSISMLNLLLNTLDVRCDPTFSRFNLPPGRSSLFKGIKNITIIDSSYNATPDGVKSMLEMFDLYPSSKKWLVLGDMIELGNEEQEEHEKLADIINSINLDKIVLVGPRVSKYTYRRLKTLPPHPTLSLEGRGKRERVKTFLMPKEALEYLLNNLKGGEVVLFKGARFLEGIIEHLLLYKNDVKKLCRREKVWEERRKKWGL